MIVVHLCWTCVPPAQQAAARAVLSTDGLPPGCHSRWLRGQGDALFDTEIWSGEDEARGFLRQIEDLLRPAGLGTPSHVEMLAAPDAVAASYLRARRHPAHLPAPRPAPDEEMLAVSPGQGPPMRHA